MFSFFYQGRKKRPDQPKKPTGNTRRRSASAARNASAQNVSQNAGQTLEFKGREVLLRRRPYKRSISLTLQVSGKIRVSAPMGVPLSRIHDFLSEHSEWIDQHLAKYATLRDAHPPKRYVQGEQFPFMGQPRTLVYRQSHSAKVRVSLTDAELIVEIPSASWSTFDVSAPHPEFARAISDFYAKEGRVIIGQRLGLLSERMGLRPSAVTFRSQKTRWGSCSSKGKISLNWRLLVAPIDVIDYVVAHELSHLRHYDHSPAFWALVGTQIPAYRQLRQWLRENQYQADFLGNQSELHG